MRGSLLCLDLYQARPSLVPFPKRFIKVLSLLLGVTIVVATARVAPSLVVGVAQELGDLLLDADLQAILRAQARQSIQRVIRALGAVQSLLSEVSYAAFLFTGIVGH